MANASTKTQTSRAVRETTAKWEYSGEDGKLAVGEVTIGYFSPTIAEMKKQRLEAKTRFENDGGIVWISEELLPMLHSLTDLPGGLKAPFPMTLEWIEEQDIRNLDSIRTAIDEDMTAGKSRPAK